MENGNSESKQILKKIAEGMATPELSTSGNEEGSSSEEQEEFDDFRYEWQENLDFDDISFDESEPPNNLPKISYEDLQVKKGFQTLSERKYLLRILGVLLSIQLIFMNILVALLIMWNTCDFSIFKNVNSNSLELLLSFAKYYVSAVLVELLGAVVYIVHSVFSEKF